MPAGRGSAQRRLGPRGHDNSGADRVKQCSWWALALGASVLVAACIEQQPVVKNVEASAAPTSGHVEATANGVAAAGDYGKLRGVDLLGGGGIGAFSVAGAAERVATSVVDVSGQPFTKALRAQVKEKSQNLWDVQLVATNETDVRSGDVLLASFWFRTEYVPVESGEAETEVNFELNRAPFEKSMTYAARVGAQWKQIFVPFVAKRDFQAGEARLVFRLGYAPQTVDFADIKLENFEKRLALADLPRTKITYPGMEPDAPWRAQAEERIDRLRKADLTVRVVGANGEAVRDAKISATLTRHAFPFGTCVPAEYLFSKEREQFLTLMREHFNIVTLENDLKWEALTDWGYPLERGSRAVDWLREAGYAVRGHVLVWPGWRELPAALKRDEGNPAKLRDAVTAHIREMMTTFKGRIDQWDVVNEPFTNHDLLDVLGYEVMADWFKLARSIDPKPKLYINDFAILSGGGGTTAHRDHYEKMIQLLVDNGAPFDGIGLQGHFGASLTGPEDLMAILDRYARFGKDIAVTEFDVVMDDEEVAGRYVRDFYTTLFSHPAVKTLTMWGFWDGNHWRKNAVMYRPDWSLKPGGQAYKDLVLGKWKTVAEGTTDGKGLFQTRGFKGEYEISVTVGERSKTVKGTLGDAGGRIDVKI